jgi:hypothetical protein
VEWLEEQARNRNLHKFTQPWHYPKQWPPRYYVDGELYCPPKVDGQAREFFAGAKDLIFSFLGRNYKFVGQSQKVPFKQHWEPFPFPQKGLKPKGKGKNPDKRPRWNEGSLEEDQTAGPAGASASKGWFT